MRVHTDERVIALTYDDGPDPVSTPQVLRELRAHGVHATFFVLAEAAERNPELLRSMLAEGHEIGLHGVDHTLLTTVSGREAARAVREAKQRVEAVTGQRLRMYRPTYGIQGMAQFLTARLLRMDVVFWTAWAQDWLDDSAEAVARRAVSAIHPGAVLLLHDTTDDTDDANLPRPTFSRGEVTRRILDDLSADGYRVLPVGTLLAGYPAVRAVTITRPKVSARGPRRGGPGPSAPA
jgi:peptidoglycan/xylan/chitin deacetylase (PgdA/CDA1 family)